MVIDSTDRERMNLNKQELVKMLGNETLAGAAVLVFANKQDLKVNKTNPWRKINFLLPGT